MHGPRLPIHPSLRVRELARPTRSTHRLPNPTDTDMGYHASLQTTTGRRQTLITGRIILASVGSAARWRRTPLRPEGMWSYDRLNAPTRRLRGDLVAKRPNAGRSTRLRQWPCARPPTPRGTGRPRVCRTLTTQASKCRHVLRVPTEGSITAGMKRGSPEDGEATPSQCTAAESAATSRRILRLVGDGSAWPRDGSSDRSPPWWR